MRKTSVLWAARENFHAALLESGLLCSIGRKPKKGTPQKSPLNADSDSATSVAIAQAIYDQIQLGSVASGRLTDQISDTKLEQIAQRFTREAFRHLRAPVPDKRRYAVERRAVLDPGRRLAELARSAQKIPGIAVLLCSGYMIAADALARGEPEPNRRSEAGKRLVGETANLRSGRGKRNNKQPVLLGGILYMWRLDNERPEAMHVIRSRRGIAPHIAVVTGESLPSRLASLALGNSSIDCVYHFALPELIAAVEDLATDDSAILVKIMVDEKRLRDIADLPLKLAM